jgi:hypothetical protein
VHPRPVDGLSRRARGEAERERDGPVRRLGRIRIADQRDTRRLARRVEGRGAYSVISM